MGAIVKRALFIVGGTIVFGVATYFLIGIFAKWYGPRYIQSDDDITTVYFYSLIFLIVVSIAGGFIGNKIYSRRKANRENGL